MLYVWAIYYIVLLCLTKFYDPSFPPTTDQEMHNMLILGTAYSQWLWGYIVVTGVLALRMLRYMRIHVGLRAFYQVRCAALPLAPCCCTSLSLLCP
jgi:bacteriorhodopsin